MTKDSGDTVSVMIRPPVEVMRWYQTRAAEMQLRDGVTITPNKLIVQDMEALKAKEERSKESKGGKK